MKNKICAVLGIFAVLLIGGVAAVAMSEKSGHENYGWKYRMTVTVETPEGIKTGSAVREMGNSEVGNFPPGTGNPADVRGEAVVVDLGERGVLFALISSDSDMEFYNAFPTRGPSTLEGIKYYASLPVGTKGTINPENFPSYPKLVTFTDLNDPKSVTLAQEWVRDDKGYYSLKNDHFENLFGAGVKLKDITLEITDEPVTWGVVDRYLPSILMEGFQNWWKTLTLSERGKIANFLQFKQGETK